MRSHGPGMSRSIIWPMASGTAGSVSTTRCGAGVRWSTCSRWRSRSL